VHLTGVCEGLPGVYYNYLVPMDQDKQAEEDEEERGIESDQIG
jgi:hypothetical protein